MNLEEFKKHVNELKKDPDNRPIPDYEGYSTNEMRHSILIEAYEKASFPH